MTAIKHIKIGLTGGIGSGKTTVAKLFEKEGFPVYYADERAKYLMHNDGGLKQKIISLFGENAYENGELNRKYIANQVFQNEKLLALLNALVHPAVAHDFDHWVTNQPSKFVIKEAAILIETKGYVEMDEVIVVTAPKELRLARVLKRNDTNEEAVLSRMKNQIDDDQRIAYAQYIIENVDLEETKKQVEKCIQQLKNKYY
jgi:dephospho-CoA kinase